MGLLDRLLGRSSRPEPRPLPPTAPAASPPSGGRAATGTTGDEEAVRRYRYLLRTAPPEAIEQAHAEAFAQLSPQQRRMVLEQLSAQVPGYERGGDDPASLARTATRAELRSPGILERVLGPRGYGGYGGGMGMGGLLAGSLLASVAGGFIGTAIAEEVFDHDGYDGYDGSDGAGADGSDVAFDDPGVDTSAVDDGGGAADGFGDLGGDLGDDLGDGGGFDDL